jgi:hypothetical protein
LVPENSSSFLTPSATMTLPYIYHPSFRGDAQHRTRNLEIPRGAIAPLWSGPSDHPGMTAGSALR